MPRKAAPLDAAGRPLPTALSLGEMLAWVLWRRISPEPFDSAAEDLSPEKAKHELASRAVHALEAIETQVWPHILAGDLPLRGKGVTYVAQDGLLFRLRRIVGPHRQEIPPESLKEKRLDVTSSSVRESEGIRANGIDVGEVWADVVVDREDVLRLWPITRAPRAQAKSRTIERCRQWLVGQMRTSPEMRPQPKDWFRNEAKRLFPGMTDNAFNQRWRQGLGETKAKWGKAGRPGQTPGKNP